MSFGVLLQIAPRLADLLKLAANQYTALRAAGHHVDADVLAAFLEVQVADWNPVIGGKRPLGDPKTKAAGCRFLAGIAFAMAGGE